jgi:hypothetical protein
MSHVKAGRTVRSEDEWWTLCGLLVSEDDVEDIDENTDCADCLEQLYEDVEAVGRPRADANWLQWGPSSTDLAELESPDVCSPVDEPGAGDTVGP